MDGAFSTGVAQKNPEIAIPFFAGFDVPQDMPAIFTGVSQSFSRFVLDTLCFRHHRSCESAISTSTRRKHICMKRAAGQSRPSVIATDDIPFGADL
jgi:hypothetical protein